MTFTRFICAPALLLAALPMAAPAHAAEPDWLTRCNQEVEGDREDALFVLKTDGPAKDGPARAEVRITSRGAGSSTIYPTEAKGLMNAYGSATLGLGYFLTPSESTPNLGWVSVMASAKDFEPLEGEITIRLEIDGKAFGPFAPKDARPSSGIYSLWLDTDEMDGDSRPPLLKAKAFARLAKAVSSLKEARMVMVQDGTDVAILPVAPKRHVEWRDDLSQWAVDTASSFAKSEYCGYGNERVN